MANKRNNRSAQRTQRRIKEAFVSLAGRLPIAEVSVSDVAQLADVSRGTFYLYYHDLLDLRDVIADDFVDEFDAEVGRHSIEGHPTSGGFEMLAAGLSFMREHHETLSVLLGPNGDLAFQRRLENVIRRYCLAGLEDNFPQMDDQTFSRLYAFEIAGAVGSIRDWLAHDCAQAPDEMADFIGTILMAGAAALAGDEGAASLTPVSSR